MRTQFRPLSLSSQNFSIFHIFLYPSLYTRNFIPPSLSNTLDSRISDQTLVHGGNWPHSNYCRHGLKIHSTRNLSSQGFERLSESLQVKGYYHSGIDTRRGILTSLPWYLFNYFLFLMSITRFSFETPVSSTQREDYAATYSSLYHQNHWLSCQVP